MLLSESSTVVGILSKRGLPLFTEFAGNKSLSIKVCLQRTISAYSMPVLGDNTTLRNMDGVIGYSYTGLVDGVVVVIQLVICRGEYRNNRLMG